MTGIRASCNTDIMKDLQPKTIWCPTPYSFMPSCFMHLIPSFPNPRLPFHSNLTPFSALFSVFTSSTPSTFSSFLLYVP